MSILRTIVVLAASAGIVIGAAACGGDDSGASPSPGITSVGGSPVSSVVTPFPTPQVTDNQVDSSASKGYTATFPTGWKFFPNRIQTRDASVDVIFEPLKAGAKAQASISVECQVTNAPQAEAHISFEATKVARIGTNSGIVQSQRQISGLNATVLTYSFKSPNEQDIPELDKQDVIFSSGGCNWKITTANLAGERATYEPLFVAFLDSFVLTN